MITIQIVERPGAHLQREMQSAMRSGQLRTFELEKRGRKVKHVRAPGYMNWASSKGVVSGEIVSPQKPDAEWDFLAKFVGRLAAKYAASIHSVSIQFPEKVDHDGKRRRKH